MFGHNNLTADVIRNAIEGDMTKKQQGKDKWVASRPINRGHNTAHIATIYHTGRGRWAIGMITVEGETRQKSAPAPAQSAT